MVFAIAAWCRAIFAAGAALALGLPILAQAQASADHAHYRAELVPETRAPAPGKRVAVALHIALKQGWHIYWSNPGDTGYAPAVTWTMPPGLTAGPVAHPAPVRLELAGLVSFVHEGDTVLLQDLQLPAGIAAGTALPLTAHLDLLVCSESTCVPDPVDLALTLTAGTGAADPAAATLFSAARRTLPKATGAGAEFAVTPGGLQVSLPSLAAASPGPLALFVDQPGAVKPAATLAPTLVDGGLQITVPRGDGDVPPVLSGVITAGKQSYAFSARKVAALTARAPGTGVPLDAGYFLVFGAAVLGGLILNLMPCVFPILSLKAMALARAGGNDAHARSEALGYSAGVIGTVVGLGAILLALRSAGSAAGWAFQLQNPSVVAGLLLLVAGIALNMAGLFELPSLSVNGKPSSGFSGSLATGALAAFIATPCTGPFMAGALGAALVMPPLAGLGVIAGLGIGMALPFFVLGFYKPARRLIPRPGQWMVTLRHVLSVPMFATALGLAWLIGRQAGIGAMTAALGAALIMGLGLWWYGTQQRAGKRGFSALAIVAAALPVVVLGVVPAPVAATQVEAGDALGGQPFAQSRLEALQREGRPVFVYFTADWCLTCKVNEATSLSSPAVVKAFASGGVSVLRGDWTRQDPAISRFLKEHGRAGVPLYLWYPAGGGSSELPQVLTPDLLVGLARRS
ncbi:MAG: protein-disulfide reductase DsbD family protein [Novosphingobium sp.]